MDIVSEGPAYGAKVVMMMGRSLIRESIENPQKASNEDAHRATLKEIISMMCLESPPLFLKSLTIQSIGENEHISPLNLAPLSKGTRNQHHMRSHISKGKTRDMSKVLTANFFNKQTMKK